MDRRSFLKGASLTAFTTLANTAQTAPPDLRIAYGGIGIECSTYSRLRTRMDEFTILRDAELNSSAGFQFLKRYPVTFMPTLTATAVPGGPIERKTYDAIKAEFLQRLTALLPLHGLYLPMHGAMFVEGMQDAETGLVPGGTQGSRAGLSPLRQGHAGRSPRQHQSADRRRARYVVRVSHRSPYRPGRNDAPRHRYAASLLARRRSARLLMWAPIPVLMPGERSSTQWEPGKRLWAQLPALNRQPGDRSTSACLSVMSGADELGPLAAVVITGTAPDNQRRLAANLAQQYWDARTEFQFGTETCTVDDCVQRAIDAKTRPAILADSGDNPTGGGNGEQATVWSSSTAPQSAERGIRRHSRPSRNRGLLPGRRGRAHPTLHRSDTRSQGQPARQGGSRGQVSACGNQSCPS